MKSKNLYKLIICLFLILSHNTFSDVVTDAELQALEKQLEQKEAEEKEKIKAEREVNAEKKKRAEEARRLAEENKRIQEEKRKLEEEKRKLEEQHLAEIERQKLEEAKRVAIEEERKREAEEAANAKVMVLFFRKSAFFGGGFAVTISNKGNPLGTLPDGSFFIHSSPVGKQTFSTDKAFTSYGFSKTFEFVPGKTYFIELLVGTTEGLNIVTKSEAIEAIKKIKNTGSINISDILDN